MISDGDFASAELYKDLTPEQEDNVKLVVMHCRTMGYPLSWWFRMPPKFEPIICIVSPDGETQHEVRVSCRQDGIVEVCNMNDERPDTPAALAILDEMYQR